MTATVFEIFEIDLPYCENTYGVAPCMAEIGVTGSAKCFNCRNTCQDTENFSAETRTLRFAKPTADLKGSGIDIVGAWITAIDFTPAMVSLGENLGQRAVLAVTLSDHQHSDAGPGLDKYQAERGYDPSERGSFWPRFRARYPSVQGFACRWRIGFAGQALEDMETWHFFGESFDGPKADGSFTIEARDALKFLDSDRAQAPALSTGLLSADIDDDDTGVTLSPAGVGDDEYPAHPGSSPPDDYYVCVGGNEIVKVTARSGDVLTIARGQLGTAAQNHSAGDRVQLVLRYAAADPADIAYDLITNYTDLDPSWLSLEDWQVETATYLGSLYTFTFTEPTGVDKILQRLVEQAGLALFGDQRAQQLRLRVIRAVPVTADQISEAHVLNKTFQPSDQFDKRVSQVQVFYALNDPTKRRDDRDNYRQSVLVEDEDSEAIFGLPAIRQVFADGIAAGGSGVAERIGNIILARYVRPPRRFKLLQMRDAGVEPELGRGFNLDWRTLQDASGAREIVPTQCVRYKPGPAILEADLEEMRFRDIGQIDPSVRSILINFDAFNINLRTLHDQSYPSDFDGVTVTFIIAGLVGSVSTALPAVDVGDWPDGFVPNVTGTGAIQAAGGNGGPGGLTSAGSSGLPGGTALFTRHEINLDVTDLKILGGGGGGGGASGGFSRNGGGGGGAGRTPGRGAATGGADGTTEAGGAGGFVAFGPGGAGGDPGEDGQPGALSYPYAPGTGGAAGPAIDGISLVTITGGPGDIRGPQVN